MAIYSNNISTCMEEIACDRFCITHHIALHSNWAKAFAESQATIEHYISPHQHQRTSFDQPDCTLPRWHPRFISMRGDAQCRPHCFTAGLQHLHSPRSLFYMLKELQRHVNSWYKKTVMLTWMKWLFQWMTAKQAKMHMADQTPASVCGFVN